MLRKNFVLITMAASLIAGAITASAQEAGALLDLLVKKRIITDQEAEEVRGELNREFSQSPAGKMKLSTPLTELEIYGDARVRYEVRNGNSGPPSTLVTNPDDAQQRNRHRYRLRLGIRGILMDDWFFGLRLETSTSNRSTNVTFGDDAGPFGKASDGAFIGQAYLGYSGFRDITIDGRPDSEPVCHHVDGVGRRYQPGGIFAAVQAHLQPLLGWRQHRDGDRGIQQGWEEHGRG